MQHSIETPSSVQRKITITLDANEVNQELDKAIRQLSRDIQLDGFRKGKVPASVIEKRFASDVKSTANDKLVNNNIQKILKDNDLNPISRINFAEIENNPHAEVKRNESFQFACEFEILPEITLPDLDNLEVELPEPKPDMMELEAFTRRIRQTGAKLEPLTEDRLPQDFDVCVIDINGTLDGKEVPNMKGEKIQIQLNPFNNKEDKDIQDLVRTMKVGEEKTGKIIVADLYPDPAYRGREIDMHVKLHSISVEELPPLDEELATKFGFPSLAELDKFITENVMSQQFQKTKMNAQNKLNEKVLEKLEFDLPPSFLAAHKNEYLIEARNFLMKQQQSPKDTEEALKRMEAEAEVEAKKQAKAQTFFLALAFREKVQVSEQELQQYIFKAAQESGQDAKVIMERLYQTGGINDVNERLIASKAAELMYTRAKKIVVDANGKPVAPPVVGEEAPKAKATAKKKAESADTEAKPKAAAKKKTDDGEAKPKATKKKAEDGEAKPKTTKAKKTEEKA